MDRVDYKVYNLVFCLVSRINCLFFWMLQVFYYKFNVKGLYIICLFQKFKKWLKLDYKGGEDLF